MCRKNPEYCQAKVKCKCCKEKLATEQENGKLSLNEVDSLFESEQYIVYVKGE